MSRVVPGLLGTFGPGTLAVMSGRTSRVVPGLIGTFGHGTLVVMSGRTSQDVPSCPRIFGRGTLVVMSGRTSQDVPSCPRTSWDFWTWDFGWVGYSGMSRVFPELLGTFGRGTLL